VDAAVEAGAFAHAFSLVQAAAPHRLQDVHLKYAMFLEDNGRFGEAEGEFVSAGEEGGCFATGWALPSLAVAPVQNTLAFLPTNISRQTA